MGEKLQQFVLRILLLTAKSFVYLRKILKEKTPASFSAFTTRLVKRTAYLLLFLVSPLYQIYRRTKRTLVNFLQHPSPWLRPLSHRYALHGLVIVVAAVAVYANVKPARSAENFGEGRLIFEVFQSDQILGISPQGALAETPNGEISGTDETAQEEFVPEPFLSYTGEVAFQPYLPTTEDSVAPRQRIEEYIVEDGDTLAAIAAKFRLRLATLLATNNLSATSILRPGQKLSILPIDGLVHTVKRGENLGGIANTYQVSTSSILSYNRIASENAIVIGQTLIIPGGKAPAPPPPPRPTPSPSSGSSSLPVPRTPAVDAGTKLLWPTVSHRINQYFTYRHFGLDIHGTTGTAIYAAEDGVVLQSQWGGDYGNMIVIQHDNGLITRYGHHSKNLAQKGDRVKRGQIIALMGSTGRSTGPHLHFEVQIGSRRVNPLTYTR